MNKQEALKALNEIHKVACEKCKTKCTSYDEAKKCLVNLNVNKLLEIVA